MRLDLRDVIHRPDAEKSFQYQLDLSQLDFYGRKPITRPVVAEGSVINHAGALVLNGTARSSKIVFITSSITIGFDKCAFIPGYSLGSNGTSED